MDCRGIRAGTTMFFPVSEPGALFFLGDVHSAQGDGETAGTGIETTAEVHFTARVADMVDMSMALDHQGEVGC